MLIRAGIADWDSEGVLVEPTPTRTDVTVGVRPLTGEQRLNLPDGVRLEDARAFWFPYTVEVSAVRPAEVATNDSVEYQGRTYRISEVAPWRNFKIAVGVREDPQ